MNFFKNNILKTFSIYIFNNVLNAAIPFILMPILTSYLNPEENGYLSMVDVFIRFTLPFILLGITTAIGTAYFRLTSEEFSKYLSNALIITVLSTLFFGLLFLVFNSFIQRYLLIPIKWIILTPLICLFQTFVQIVLILYQSKKKAFHYGRFQIGLTLTNLSLSLFFVAVLNYNWQGRMLGITLSYFIFFIIAVIILKKMNYLRFEFSKKITKDILLFGLPLVPHLLSAPIIQMLDRIIMLNIIGKEWVGLYAVSYQIGISVGLITVASNQAYVPNLYEKLKNNPSLEIKRNIVKQNYMFMALFIFIVLALFLITPLLFHFHFINPKYILAKSFILPISIGSAIYGMYFMVVNYIFYEKKTYLLAYVTFGNAALSVLLNLLLIPKFGAMGAAYTYVITSISVFVTVWILSNKVYPMPWFSFYKKN